MTASNTTRAYGWAARAFHWIVAALILAAIGLGLYANSLPQGGEAELQAVFAAFSIHKTVGMAVLFLATLRILWTLRQIRPRPLHPRRRLETLLAETVHWALWIGMIVMPLSGWLLHSAAPGGFSRILWPLGQRLPFVPEDAHLAESFARFHETGWWVLAGLIALHVAGALKHALIDRDDTLARMAGNPDRLSEPPEHVMSPRVQHVLAALGALVIWGATATLPAQRAEVAAQAATATAPTLPASAVAPAESTGAPLWQVQQGTLGITVQQSGNPVAGQFGQWQARIAYDPESRTGQVAVDIDVASLTLGSVSSNATGPDFLNAPAHPTAQFEAEILPPAAEGQPHIARGTLTIAGKSIPAELPFALTLAGNSATAKGEMQVDRRDFGIGAGYADESTVGFAVAIGFELSASRQP
ncbi:cytochrome b/b6 domain-containing protein [Paracoccus mangrovi]|uniref:Cytochrome b/b6 domain-containing protein n=1 Tax=Paracoccus mangrovi TaxID=1715645 RepID=A0ABV7R7Y5_9RHOB